jgi:hypothetical protein
MSSLSSFSSLSSTSDFQVWLDQELWIEDNSKMARRKYICAFADDLTEFMRFCGYTMDMRWNKGHYIVAKWMYMIHVQEFVTKKYDGRIHYAGSYHRNWPEDFLEYTHIMGFDTISSFMERWRLYEDFDPETRVGQRILHELQNLLYPFIDMDRSKNGGIFDDEEDSEHEEAYKGRDDVYIMEAREGLHGGRGSKV